MPRHQPALRPVLVAILLGAFTIPAAAGGASPEAKALARALRLLPQRPSVSIRLIDPDLAADGDAIRRLDAFLVREPDGTVRQAIYLNRRSQMMEKAIGGRDIDVAILAAVIRHEMEHLRGGGEKEARRVEREFFQSLVFAGKVPTDEGLAYLRDLAQHHQLREG
jgi:hypothetical protein